MTDILTPPKDPKANRRFWREMKKLERGGMLLTASGLSRTGAARRRKSSASPSPTAGAGSGKRSPTQK